MTDKTKIIADLQTALSMELTAAHQYQLHACVLKDWGLDRLATQMRQEMMEELAHSEAYIERILFLNGKPDLVLQKSPALATSLREMLTLDLEEEKEAITFYTQASRTAYEGGDIGSKSLFERIVLDEEEHMGWLQLQIELLKRMGEPAYISKHMSPP